MNTLHVNTNHCEFDKATLIGNVKTYFIDGYNFRKKIQIKNLNPMEDK